ncbi:DNA polymerase III subunit delta' [Microvirga pudoricolor]|uniref:DNA polymerase III subunit delta' n=1 Tax=Microvirga pudoricolor TaxID=2778729 RepID=UPI00194FC0D2|nr:DNA polymerase III subunit delta' [Microvirga pudoricolor]MBM6595707.1 DNA polymerase III subunit delta' [Microvirga pudoricolor]
MPREPDDETSPDQLAGTTHPRDRFAFFGHREGEEAFLDGIRSERLHHAWLIGGPPGIGKATLAYRVARMVLDLHNRDASRLTSLGIAEDSRTARQVSAMSHPNLSILRRAPATDKKGPSATIQVDAVRKTLGMFGSTAADGGYRVCIVDSAEDLTASSANALLKMIEEPPPRSIFLIVSHAPQRLLPTIRSRCRRLLLRPLADRDIRSVISSMGEGWAAPEPLLARAVALSDGSARRAFELLDEDKVAYIDKVTGLLNALPSKDDKGILALAESLARKDADDTYELTLETVERWAGDRIQAGAHLGAARLAPLVEVCEKIARQAREIRVFNLDRRPFILELFDDLAEAVRRTA